MRQADNTPAPWFSVSPSAQPVAVSWDASYKLPDLSYFPNTDYLYFNVPDNFTVTAVTVHLLNLRHYSARDVVVTLMRPNDAVNEVFLINQPCSWASPGQQSTFGGARAVTASQVNATSAGANYYFVDDPPVGSIQGVQCPNNEAGINPVPGNQDGTYQPMDPTFPGTQGNVVNGIWLADLPGSFRFLTGANAAGVWTLRYSDMILHCASRGLRGAVKRSMLALTRARRGAHADSGWMNGARLLLSGISASGAGATPLADAHGCACCAQRLTRAAPPRAQR